MAQAQAVRFARADTGLTDPPPTAATPGVALVESSKAP